MLPDGYQSLTDPPQPPHELYFFRPNGRKRELLGEGPHGEYVVGSTAYLLHATKQWNKRIKYYHWQSRSEDWATTVGCVCLPLVFT